MDQMSPVWYDIDCRAVVIGDAIASGLALLLIWLLAMTLGG